MMAASWEPSGLRVVFLDDDPRMRLALVRTAAVFGVRATPVATPAALRAELRWFEADAAIVDFHLGGGRVCTELVRELSASHFPVVVWTGDVGGALNAIGMMAPIVPKTTDTTELFAELVRAVDGARPKEAQCL